MNTAADEFSPPAFFPELAGLNRQLNYQVRKALLSVTVSTAVTYPGLLLNMTGKACKNHEAIVILGERGFGQDAGLLLRSLAELVVDVYWIAKDPGPRLEMWEEYGWILKDRLPLPPDRAQAAKVEVDEIRREARRVRAKYGHRPRNSWSGKSIEEMAQEVGYVNLYQYAYRLLSNIEHSSSRGFVGYKVDTPQGPRMNIGPGKEYVFEVLATAYGLLVDLATLANDVLSLGVASVLKNANEERGKLKIPA